MQELLDGITVFRQNLQILINYGILAVLGILAILFFSSFCRFLFGKKGQLKGAVVSALDILIVYGLCILPVCLQLPLPPLPFFESGRFLSLADMSPWDLCSHLLRLLIIAFLMNLMQDLLPAGKTPVKKTLFRILSAVAAIGSVFCANYLITGILPPFFLEMAPMTLLLCLVCLILLGSLKPLVGTALLFADPLLAALYSFFFASFLGRHLARAMVTAALLTAVAAAVQMLFL